MSAIAAPAAFAQSSSQDIVIDPSTTPLPGSNQIFVLQDSTSGSGNTLFVDQSGARNSLVTGNSSGTAPATQFGSNNSAEVSIVGDGGRLILNQGTAAAPGTGNQAFATLSGSNPLGTIQQLGTDNIANLTIDGLATGELFQDGEGNDGALTVTGNNAFGRLEQIGSNLEQALTVTGNNTEVTFTLTGNALAPVTANNSGTATQGGVQVITNANSVTISQSAFPSR